MVSATHATFLDHEAFPNQSAKYLPVKVASMLFPPASSTLLLSVASPSPSAAVMVIATAVATAVANAGDSSRPGAENGECDLLGPFALVIQGSLGALALLSLVYKRWRERPQRPLKIWAYDASKQVVGSMLLHIANLLMSMLSSGQLAVPLASAGAFQANPCSFYLLNLAIDTTIGIPILIVLLRLLTHAFSLTPLGEPAESIQSGNYGQPPKASWWLKQSFIYFLGLLGMKFCVFVIFQLCPWIVRVGDWALRWTENNEMVQVFFVMLFFPVVMNAIQYYIIDNFIKEQKPSDHEALPTEDDDYDDRDEGSVNEWRRSHGPNNTGDDESDSGSDDEANKHSETGRIVGIEDKELPSNTSSTPRTSSKKLNDYDPAKDGERSDGSSRGGLDDGSASSKKSTPEGNGI